MEHHRQKTKTSRAPSETCKSIKWVGLRFQGAKAASLNEQGNRMVVLVVVVLLLVVVPVVGSRGSQKRWLQGCPAAAKR